MLSINTLMHYTPNILHFAPDPKMLDGSSKLAQNMMLKRLLATSKAAREGLLFGHGEEEDNIQLTPEQQRQLEIIENMPFTMELEITPEEWEKKTPEERKILGRFDESQSVVLEGCHRGQFISHYAFCMACVLCLVVEWKLVSWKNLKMLLKFTDSGW